MGRMIITDCAKCTARFEWDTSNDEQICPRCVLMNGSDVAAILVELRKNRVPGQEPVLKLIEVLAERIKLTEANVQTALLLARTPNVVPGRISGE